MSTMKILHHILTYIMKSFLSSREIECLFGIIDFSFIEANNDRSHEVSFCPFIYYSFHEGNQDRNVLQICHLLGIDY